MRGEGEGQNTRGEAGGLRQKLRGKEKEGAERGEKQDTRGREGQDMKHKIPELKVNSNKCKRA